MKLSQVPVGARFYWSGNKTQSGSYCLKCSSLVVYHLQSRRFAILWPWSEVDDVEVEHEDDVPAAERIQRAHQQAIGTIAMLALFVGLFFTAVWYFLL